MQIFLIGVSEVVLKDENPKSFSFWSECRWESPQFKSKLFYQKKPSGIFQLILVPFSEKSALRLTFRLANSRWAACRTRLFTVSRSQGSNGTTQALRFWLKWPAELLQTVTVWTASAFSLVSVQAVDLQRNFLCEAQLDLLSVLEDSLLEDFTQQWKTEPSGKAEKKNANLQNTDGETLSDDGESVLESVTFRLRSHDHIGPEQQPSFETAFPIMQCFH